MRAAYNPHGAALLDCYRGEAGATLIVHQDGERDDVPAAFWLRTAIDPLEAVGLDVCRGRVLDVGAGAGVHALELQRRGFDVSAIDIAPECVAIMRERGVRSALAVDLFEFDDGVFDTVLALCNGLDKVGRLADLPRFLDRTRALLAPGGQLVADLFESCRWLPTLLVGKHHGGFHACCPIHPHCAEVLLSITPNPCHWSVGHVNDDLLARANRVRSPTPLPHRGPAVARLLDLRWKVLSEFARRAVEGRCRFQGRSCFVVAARPAR